MDREVLGMIIGFGIAGLIVMIIKEYQIYRSNKKGSRDERK